MGKRKYIDIVDIKQAVKNGLLKTYIARGIDVNNRPINVIYLKDMETKEVVQIGVITDEEGEKVR